MVDRDREPPYEGGSQPVREEPTAPAGAGRTVGQTVVIVIGVLVILAALLWLLVPFGAG